MKVDKNIEDNALAGLSPEELAALAEDAGEEVDALKEIADAEIDPDDDADPDADANPDPDVLADESEAVKDFMPTQAVYAVDNFDQRMTDFKNAKADLREQLNNGDIDLDQYEAKKEEIAEQETAVRIQQANAEHAARQNDHLAKERWNWEQDQFFSVKENAIYKDKIFAAALNAAVIDLANDPKNANQKGMFFLNEADKIVRERFGLAAVAAERKPADQGRRPDLTKIPKTLSNLPSADTEQSNDGEFSHLEKLSGMELERAVAKLTPDQVERYVRG